jgi:hypothetical protein
MYYEINVAVKGKGHCGLGKHLFATAPRSITSEHQLKQVLALMVEKFPESEGYQISVTRQECVGYGLDVDEILGEQHATSVRQ